MAYKKNQSQNRKRKSQNKNRKSNKRRQNGGGCGCSKTNTFFSGGSPFLDKVANNENIVIPNNEYRAGDPMYNTLDTRMEQVPGPVRGGGKRRRQSKRNNKKNKNKTMRGGSFVPAEQMSSNWGSGFGINQLAGKLIGTPYLSSSPLDQPLGQYNAQNKFMV